ncbi:hypothetical protein [Robertkochia solimangrovi]|uniref:hypothetical protein n=1 Tax=Robertkochia solimangrovi TaxID=2213046 RepID=UPI00117C2175|nr:hypothetical protein [Robertkochia solimangrovi]TRZ43230.1 hypothetical protein DMZ48_11110 [Robertkochia solimangrovi]
MNVTNFSNLLQDPGKIDAGHLETLRRIIEEYPYFQPARAIYLKALKEQGSFKYNATLKATAAYTADRTMLFEFITSEVFIQNQVAEKIIELTTNHEVREMIVEMEEVIVRDNKTAFDFNKVDSDAVMDPELFTPKHPEQAPPKDLQSNEETPEKTETPEAILQIGKPLNFGRSETHSFSEWLRLSGKFKPIDRSGTSSEMENGPEPEFIPEPHEEPQSDNFTKRPTLEDKMNLIDKFIENSPKISPVSDQGTKGNLAKVIEVEKSELMTETLARVYLEQKKYKKAIQAYKILSLKYPEKSGFFADQIRAITKLKDSN